MDEFTPSRKYSGCALSFVIIKNGKKLTQLKYIVF